jgi:hypothetical protein
VFDPGTFFRSCPRFENKTKAYPRVAHSKIKKLTHGKHTSLHHQPSVRKKKRYKTIRVCTGQGQNAPAYFVPNYSDKVQKIYEIDTWGQC